MIVSHLAAFLIGIVLCLSVVWFWEWMTMQRHGPLIRELDEYKAAIENERILEEFLQGFPPLSRVEIWSRMSWLWKETRGWALRSGSLTAVLFLAAYALLYIGAWFKTLLFPNAHDLRILLGGRAWVLHVAQKRPPRKEKPDNGRG